MTMEPYEMLLPQSTWLSEGLLVHVIVTLLFVGRVLMPLSSAPELIDMEVSMANGETTPQACRESGNTEQTYCRWRQEYDGLKLEQAKRLKESGEGELAA
jgi:hypothetical protein